MSLFDNLKRGQRRGKASEARPEPEATLGSLEDAPVEREPAEPPPSEPAHPELVHPEPVHPEVVAPEGPGPAEVSPDAAPSPTRHERVEGIDRVEDVVIPQEDRPAPPEKKRRALSRPSRSRKGKSRSSTERPQRRKVPLIAGFRNPATRPRYILWSGAALIGLAAFMIAALGITSTRWFCSEGCHKVQDDTILAYEHSTHSEISCMACHMPAGATPVEFILHKAEALGELYLTVTDQFELPLNPESHVARTMSSEQCTQCHNMERRRVTASEGVIIDHAIHEENGVTCAICHNRVAHNEDFQLTLKSPGGESNRKHEVYGSMTACFRCHTQGVTVGGGKAPGDCIACHPKDMQLKPESHLAEDFFPAGHGDLGKAEAARVASATIETSGVAEAEGEIIQTADSEAEPEGGHGEGEGVGESLGRVDSINECSTCHTEKFCSDCHGLPMPHEGGFAGSHAKLGTENPKQCEMCHGPSGTSCDSCHHGSSLDRALDTKLPWLNQHMVAVRDVGAAKCIDECHNPTYCARCHVRGRAE